MATACNLFGTHFQSALGEHKIRSLLYMNISVAGIKCILPGRQRDNKNINSFRPSEAL